MDAWRAQRRARRSLYLVFHQGGVLPVRLHLAARHAPAHPLRPTDALRLAGVAAALGRQRAGDGGCRRVWPVVVGQRPIWAGRAGDRGWRVLSTGATPHGRADGTGAPGLWDTQRNRQRRCGATLVGAAGELASSEWRG